MTADPTQAYLVVDEQVGVFWAGFDRGRASKVAQAINAAVVTVPILEDLRSEAAGS